MAHHRPTIAFPVVISTFPPIVSASRPSPLNFSYRFN